MQDDGRMGELLCTMNASPVLLEDGEEVANNALNKYFTIFLQRQW